MKPLLVQRPEEIPDDAAVVGRRRPGEEVVADPEIAEIVLGSARCTCPRPHAATAPLVVGDDHDRRAVLVRSGHHQHVVSAQPVVAGEDVRGDAKPDTWPMCRGPAAYGQATATRIRSRRESGQAGHASTLVARPPDRYRAPRRARRAPPRVAVGPPAEPSGGVPTRALRPPPPAARAGPRPRLPGAPARCGSSFRCSCRADARGGCNVLVAARTSCTCVCRWCRRVGLAAVSVASRGAAWFHTGCGTAFETSGLSGRSTDAG